MPLSSLHKGIIVSVPSPLLFRALRVTCLRVVLGNHQRHSLTFSLPLSRHYVAEVICYRINRTKGLVARYYWWLQLSQNVQDYVKGCTDCQRNKVNTHPKKAPLVPITPIHKALPFQTIAMDFIMKLPESAGYDSILTITNHDCTKMLIAIPCREAINAKGIAELFLRQIFPRFGLPAKFISNQDP